MKVLKHCRIKIEALSPLHVGSGEKIGKKEYIYLPWDQMVIVPDIYRMHGELQRNGNGQAFQDYLLKNNKDALGSWLKALGYRKSDYLKWKRYELSAGDAFLTRDSKAKDILCFIKDPYGMPYMPGSSLKGMFRTALLAWEIKQAPLAYKTILENIRNNAGRGGRSALARETPQLEEAVFHTLDRGQVKRNNAVCCNLSGLIVSDSEPISVEQLVLTQKIDYTLEGKEKPLPILREALIPGTEIYFDLTIDTQICPYSLENILEALQYFQEVCYNRFYRRFKRGSREEGIVWIGGGAGFLSKTVLYPIFGAEAYKVANSVFQATLGKNYEVHKHQGDLSRKLSPHMCKCTKYDGKLYDMGMGKIEILEE